MPGSGDEGKMQELDELRYVQQVYQNQFVLLNNAINVHLQDLQSLGAAQAALENIDTIKDRETLTHAGANIYMRASIKEAGSVIVGVGGGYLIEKNVDEAKRYLGGLVERKRELVNTLTKNRGELQGALIDISYRIESADTKRA